MTDTPRSDTTATTPGGVLRGIHLAYLALYVVLIFAPGWLKSTGLFSDEANAWIGVGRYVVLAGVGLWVFRDAITKSITLAKTHPWRMLVWTLFVIVAGELAPLIPGMLLASLGWMPDTMSNDAAVGALTERVPAIVFFLTVALLGPITEELVFREALLRRIPRVIPTWVALVVSSLLFGLLHVKSLEELPLALIYGSVGLTYGIGLIATRGNLFVPFIGHAVHNGVPALGVLVG